MQVFQCLGFCGSQVALSHSSFTYWISAAEFLVCRESDDSAGIGYEQNTLSWSKPMFFLMCNVSEIYLCLVSVLLQ